MENANQENIKEYLSKYEYIPKNFQKKKIQRSYKCKKNRK